MNLPAVQQPGGADLAMLFGVVAKVICSCSTGTLGHEVVGHTS